MNAPQRRTAADYLDLFQRLLPLGRAWQRLTDSVFTRLLHACAEEPARIDAAVWTLISESNPLTTVQAMPEWELQHGLPGPCSDLAATLEERRRALLLKFQRPGGQSEPYFVRLAGVLGYSGVWVEEYAPLTVESGTVEQPLNDAPGGGEWIFHDDKAPEFVPSLYDGWRFVWLVHAAESSVRELAVESGTAEEPLRRWGDAFLECEITRVKPSQTKVFFAYGT